MNAFGRMRFLAFYMIQRVEAVANPDFLCRLVGFRSSTRPTIYYDNLLIRNGIRT